MNKKLTKEEKERISSFFEGDELYMVCDQAFLSRAGRLEGVKADTEDIFCEVALLLDFLNDFPEFLSDQKDMGKHFSYLIKKYREWEKATVADREVLADTVFRIVRRLMCHRYRLSYCEELFDAMGEVLKSISKQEDAEAFEDVLQDYSYELDEWINQDYDGHLYGQIEEAMKEKKEKQKPGSGRKAIDPKDITASFTYLPKHSNRNILLTVFCHCLQGVFIQRNTDEKTFIDIFSGTTTTQKITWIRGIRELHYLIDKLVELKLITWSSSYGKWQMVCARFNIRMKKRESIDDSMTDDSFIIESLLPTQFTKDGGVPDAHDELDRIIRILNPKYNVENSLHGFMDEFEHDEIEDYRDALANDLKVVGRLS